MATVLRVKRKRNEEPAEKLVIGCKKVKHSLSDGASVADNNTELKEVFKFAGTLDGKDHLVSKHLHEQSLNRDRLHDTYKQHPVDITSKARSQRKQAVQKNRYKIISSNRDIPSGDAEGANSEQKKEDRVDNLHVFDLETVLDESQDDKASESSSQRDTITCNSVAMVREKVPQTPEDEYVYDIYLTNTPDFDFRSLEDILTVEAFNEDLVYGEYRDDLNEGCYEDDDDSNDEDNWRNDYPDEDQFYYGYDNDEEHPGFDSDGEPIANVFQRKLHVGLGDDLSSDDDDVRFEDKYARHATVVDELEDFDDL